jgi:predicted NBD/HSP70 family sugar kinase
MRMKRAKDMSRAKVLRREKWRHKDDKPNRKALIDRLAEMLETQIRYCKKKGIRLAPYIGIACPGLIAKDGSISRGAQNLPGNWESDNFHLPSELCKRIPTIHGAPTMALMHNDAVVQGLSELPFMKDVKRWAVLTIGTGLGNASYTNKRVEAG